MADFVYLLGKALEQSNKSLYQIEKLTGIEKSYLSKLRLGKRLPASAKTVIRIMTAISADERTKNAVLRAWSKERMEVRFGEGAWDCIAALQETLFQKSAEPDLELTVSPEIKYGDIISGKENIRQYLLKKITEVPKGQKVDIWGCEDCGYMPEIMRAAFSMHSVECRHILYFQTGNPIRDDARNIRVFRDIWDTILANISYKPVICYRVSPDVGTMEPLFSGIIMIGKLVLVLSGDYETCMLLTDEEQGEMFRKNFKQAYTDGVMLISEYANEQCWEVKKREVEESGRILYVMNRHAELFRWYKKNPLLLRRKYICLAAAEDIRAVKQYGRIPGERMEVLGEEERRCLLEGLYAVKKEFPETLQIFCEPFKGNGKLEIVCSSERLNYIVLHEKAGKERRMSLQEPVLAKWLYCFMEYLAESEYIYSEKEQLDLLLHL